VDVFADGMDFHWISNGNKHRNSPKLVLTGELFIVLLIEIEAKHPRQAAISFLNIPAFIMKTLQPGNSIQRVSMIGFSPIKFLNSFSNWRKLIAVLGVTAVAGIGQTASAEDQKPTIPVIVKDTTSSYWQTVFAGARKAAKELNVNVIELGAQSEGDVNGQVSILENAVSGNPAAVVISPTQQTALGKPIDEAAKKVKIIGIDSAADSNSFTSFLQTDNEKGGRIAADALAAAIEAKYGKAEGQVALINFLPGVGSLQARDKGFKEQLAAKYPGLKLVAEKVADGQAVTGLNIMTDLITAYPDLRGVFSDALFIGQGAGQAIAENKAGDRIKFVTFDSDNKLIGFLKDGAITALVVQDPFRMGYDGVKTALAASKGEKVEKTIDTGVTVITKANMEEPRSQELLNPKLK
jgi:ribose transport system substrate-binding protein